MEYKIRSYPKILAVGHHALKELFTDEVLIEEKIDGSQFSFAKINGELICKSKNQQIILDAPEKMFSTAVDISKTLDLRDGWTYRAEYLQKPKHNVLAYNRVPEKHLMIIDINTGYEQYLSHADKVAECARLGLECVPCIFKGHIHTVTDLMSFMDTISILGKQKIEGIVIKNYNKFSSLGYVLMGKYVSEEFKEIHKKHWREAGGETQKSILDLLGAVYCNRARWNKALIHLKEQGQISGELKDISTLIKEIPKDIEEECKEEILQKLWKWAWPHIARASVRGVPQWYKDTLAKDQFEQDLFIDELSVEATKEIN